MSFDPTQDVVFAGIGVSAVCYYRVMLPAMALGADWCGIGGNPPNIQWCTGLVRKESALPAWTEYKVIILQQPWESGWFDKIKEWQAAGCKVLFEVDDYLHGIRKVEAHDFRKSFDQKYLARAEAVMRMCDGIICSTPFIAKRYAKFGPTYICENGLDLNRYALTRPKRDKVNIGWAGATGHRDAIRPWLQQVMGVMQLRENTTFVSIGQPWADAAKQHVGEDRAIAVPFAAVEQYPAAMTMMDIALAPAGKGSFFRGKSDLRWLEAGALGIPIIANPMVYSKITDGVDGFHANSAHEMTEVLMRLIDDPELRTTVGENARKYVRENRAIGETAQQWVDVCEQAIG